MKRLSNFLWPLVALVAMGFSFWLLYKELRGLSAGDVLDSLAAISKTSWLLAALSSLVAYAALAWYDRIALLHLGRKFSWTLISLVSFTTYALSHNIGFSMFSGAVVRYRVYSTKGLSMAEVAFLVGFCSFTFALGTVLLGGLVLVFEPQIVQRLVDAPVWLARTGGFAMLGFVALYFAGSTLHLKPLQLGKFKLEYPSVNITLRQMVAAPIELLGAAGIIYFALPEAGNPGYFIVLGIFLASFSAGLLSHAPGGLGVIEFVFVKAMPPDAPQAQVVAALIVFRLLYLIIPLLFSLVVVFFFERGRLSEAIVAARATAAAAKSNSASP